MARVTIVVLPTQAGRIVNTATVDAAQRDRTRWNNRASIATIVGRPRISVSRSRRRRVPRR